LVITLALVSACQGQLLFWELKTAFGHRSANNSTGATLMRVDLKKVDAEITGLRSKLAAIAPGSREASDNRLPHVGFVALGGRISGTHEPAHSTGAAL
jgi:hypothetical protein